MDYYPQICKIAHEIIKEGFSANVIRPGETTTDDVVWWYRERIRDLKLVTWFHPTVDLQRSDNAQFDFLSAFSKAKVLVHDKPKFTGLALVHFDDLIASMEATVSILEPICNRTYWKYDFETG